MTGSRRPFGVRFEVQVPAGKSSQGLSNGNAEGIAIALSEVLGVPLQSDWVQIRKLRGAGAYEITVVLEDSMADLIEFCDECTWTSITDPALVGYGIDRRPRFLNLAQHGEAIGKTRSGKSCLVHVILAHLTRCRDAVVWVCGAEKLYDFVAGWLDPYAGSDWPLPFDWTATGQRDTLEMLIAAMNVARWRQRQPMSARVGWSDIVLVLDEASFALRDRSVRGTYQGQSVTAGQMAAMISQGAGSAGVWLLRATQRSTNDHGGDQGADTSANVGYSAAFRSKDWSEVGRLMGDYKLPMPRHPGQYWLDPGDGDGPVLLKAPYVQEIDPSKPQLHSGLTLSDVAWTRRHFPRHLDGGSQEAAGLAYARRHTRMDDGMQRYLTSAGFPVPSDGDQPEQSPAGGGQAGYDLVMGQLAKLDGGPEREPSAVATLSGRRSRADRIADIVAGSTEPMALREVVAALRESGDEASEQVVTNALTRLVSEGRLARPDRGRYVAG